MNEEMFKLIEDCLLRDGTYYAHMALKSTEKKDEYLEKAEKYLSAIELLKQIKILNPEMKYTLEEMFLFSGFCAGKKFITPSADVKEIFEEWKTFYNK